MELCGSSQLPGLRENSPNTAHLTSYQLSDRAAKEPGNKENWRDDFIRRVEYFLNTAGYV
ncbi:hypothetical protein E2C01_041248 [Portunus trituberculatus]|uniref:Uncharacterized protein n=1 Tax=Portunus trituberculatus TaxID=210409 RepID=A0A5B7FIQ8_PORTR|nr:hypothetical protein [Portunus trituberculatus]